MDHSGRYAGKAGYVEVVIQQSEPTIFMSLFSRTAMTVSARAVATNTGDSSGCVYTLSPNGATNPNSSGSGFYMCGSDIVNTPTCGIVVNSTAPNALSFNGSDIVTAQSIGVVGGYSHNGSTIISPTPVTGLAPTSDPLASLPQPPVTPPCAVDPSFTGSNIATLNPGCFNALTIRGSSIITLNPGVYVIDGNLNIGGSAIIKQNAGAAGSGVTFFITNNGAVTINGSTNLTISAPTTGPTTAFCLNRIGLTRPSLTLPVLPL